MDIALAEAKRSRWGGRLGGLLSHPWTLPIIVCVAVMLRVALFFVSGARERFSDEWDYWNIATSISHGSGYRFFGHLSAYRPPAMPYFLSAGMLLFGERYWAVVFVEILLLCVVPFLVLQIAARVSLPRPYAVLAAILVALHPGLNFAATTIYPTTITTILLTFCVLLTLDAIAHDSVFCAGLAGSAAALAGFATTVFVPYGIVLAVVALMKSRVRVSLCILFFSMLPAAAWVARNHSVLQTYSLATNGGFNMELGANDHAEPRSGNLISPEITPQEPTGGEVDWDHAHRERAERWIRAHRLRYIGLVVLRGLVVFDSVGRPATNGVQTSRPAQLLGWMMLPFMLLGLLGLAFNRFLPLAWMTVGALLLVIVSSGLTIAKPRFRFPCDPLLIIFSMLAIEQIVKSSRSRKENRTLHSLPGNSLG